MKMIETCEADIEEMSMPTTSASSGSSGGLPVVDQRHGAGTRSERRLLLSWLSYVLWCQVSFWEERLAGGERRGCVDSGDSAGARVCLQHAQEHAQVRDELLQTLSADTIVVPRSTTMFYKCNEIESQQINKNKQKVQVGISIFWNRTWPWNSF